MGYLLELELAVSPTDSNKILGRHWRSKHEVFERIKKEIFLKTRGKTPALPLEKFQLSFTRYSKKTLDYDNFVASLKAYIDGLVLAGVIKDDSWEYVKQINTDQKISNEMLLKLRVEEA